MWMRTVRHQAFLLPSPPLNSCTNVLARALVRQRGFWQGFLDFRITALLHRRTDAFIARLSEAVAFQISGDPAFRPAVHNMSDWLAAQLRAVGVEVKQIDLGTHVMDGQTLP
ncbi:hypothetical protein FB451DRAFT_1189122 [Mycena latifolia]|nr:hypothetical protein FB451DRAFT_1189122 [Mycena latifolia]